LLALNTGSKTPQFYLAVQNNEVYAVNTGAYFSKPRPKTIVGLEGLAKIVDPEGL